MNQSKQNRALTYFEPLQPNDVENTKFVCKIEKCGSTLEARNRYNLVSHLKKQHEDIYKIISTTQYHENEESLQMKRLKLIQNLTEIVTVNGRSFLHLSDSGTIGLMYNDLKVLQTEGYATGIHSPDYPAVKKHITYLASEIIDKIKNEVRGKFVSVLTDIGTKNRRDILGLALQYILNGRVIIRSIGMLLLTTSHTAELIKTEILNCLKVFDVAPNQVISITTDNGSNMLLAVKLINNEIDENQLESCDGEADEPPESNAFVSLADLEIETGNVIAEYQSAQSDETTELENDVPIDPEVQEMLDESSHYMDLLKELENIFATQTLKSNGIRCAAHVLQLAVKAALKTKSIKALLSICRMVCKLLRTKQYGYRMQKQNINIKLPRLDCSTRWSSTYRMVNIISFAIYYSELMSVG